MLNNLMLMKVKAFDLLIGVGKTYVSDAKALKENAPELLEEVRKGEITIPEAKRMQKAWAW